jgi:hypothetical protein
MDVLSPALNFRIACYQGRASPFSLVVLLLCAGQAPLPEPVTDQETELGQAVYNQLRDKGEIIESSPLYDSLKPIADAISRVAQPRYNHPFKFFLIHETPPKRIRYARWKRLCSRFIALFCEEHRTGGGYALP